MRDGYKPPQLEAPQASTEIASLPFDEGQQMALVGYALTNENFFKQVKDRLQPKWFTNALVAQIFKFYKEFYDAHQRAPSSPEEFETWKSILAMSMADRVKLQHAIGVCRAKCGMYGLDYLSEQLTTWQKTQIFFRDIPQIANLLNSRRVADAEALYFQSSREVQVTRFEGAPPADFREWRGLRDATETEVKDALTTGLRLLDRHLLPEAEGNGGLVRGDTTILVAPTNTGKTSAMITIARHNVQAKKSVLFITREGRQNDIMQKFWQSFLRKTRPELWASTRTPEGERYMDAMSVWVSNYMTYISMTKPSMDVEEVISIVLNLQATRKALTGKGYDMLVVDYPGIFQCAAAKGARWEYRQIQDYIYRQFVQLGLDENFHVLAAAQTNREGSKINRGIGVKRILSLEDISEAFGIAMSATNVLTLNRSPEAMADNRLAYGLMKSRGSETGWVVTCRTDYSRCLTHADDLGATAHRGSGTMDEMIDGLLKQYNGRDVPEGYAEGLRTPKNG